MFATKVVKAGYRKSLTMVADSMHWTVLAGVAVIACNRCWMSMRRRAEAEVVQA